MSAPRLLECPADGPPFADDRDVVELVARALETRAELIVIPVPRLTDAFFRLSSGVAGAILQKLVTYQLRVAIVGDVARHADASAALRDFIRECNRGNQIWFVADRAALDARLASSHPGA
jgi:hypothetical protein